MKLFITLLFISCGVLATMASPLENVEKRLVKRTESDPGVWMTESEIWKLIESKENFIDITDHSQYPVNKIRPQSTKGNILSCNCAMLFILISISVCYNYTTNCIFLAIPTTLKFQEVVKSLIGKIDRDRVESFVREFSTFHTRYYQSTTGEESQKWLLSQVQASLQNYAGESSVREVDHGFRQNSIVARIEGSDSALKSEVVILGAHQDSVNLRGSALRSPGICFKRLIGHSVQLTKSNIMCIFSI